MEREVQEAIISPDFVRVSHEDLDVFLYYRKFQKYKEDLFKSKRGEPNEARFMALALTSEISGLKQSKIAKHFKILSYRTIGTSCYRLRQLLKLEK